MELLTEIAIEEQIPVTINIHQVSLAREHADRIIGLSDGRTVFDGSPAELDERGMDTIYRDRPDEAADENNREGQQGVKPPEAGTDTESEWLTREVD